MSVHRDMIINLLHNLGSRREVSRYLDEFGDARDVPPVLIKVGGAIVEERLVELASAVACLGHVGVRPVVVHGAGPQISRALADAGVESEFIDGHRVTTVESLSIVRSVMSGVSDILAREISAHGVPAQAIGSDVLFAQPSCNPALGRVGEVTRVEIGPVLDARADGVIPVVSPLATGESGDALNVNADVAARELAIALGAQKIVYLTSTGGLLDERGRLIPAVTLADDYDDLILQSWVTGGMKLKLEEIRSVLDRLPRGASAAITSPEHLASELFTYRGAGTLVRRGFAIKTHEDGGYERGRLAQVISRSFGRTLREDYFEHRDIRRVLVAGDYSAAAVLTNAAPAPYLDKFAVGREAQGQGLAGSLWKRITAVEPSIFWRSRAGNEINPWYASRADGMQRAGEWIVFWRGVQGAADIARAVRHALSLEDSFESNAVTKEPALAG